MENNSNQPKEFKKGLYKGVKISVPTLNKMIILGLVVLVGLIVFGISTGGYRVTFNSKGGSDVDYQEAKYGDPIIWPEDPTREGYEFKGWALDEGCKYMADKDMMVETNIEVFACWQ